MNVSKDTVQYTPEQIEDLILKDMRNKGLIVSSIKFRSTLTEEDNGFTYPSFDGADVRIRKEV